LGALASGGDLHDLTHACEDGRVNWHQLAATSQRIDLDAAGVLEGVHREKSVGNGRTHGQQAVVVQHQKVGLAQIGLQARPSPSCWP
jgi:hypothetical protein